MYDNYGYPWGADCPDAPWNQPADPEDKEVDVIVSTTLSKPTTVWVNDYIAELWEDCDVDDEGGVSYFGGIDYDYSNCNFVESYKEQELSIIQLLNILKEYVRADMEGSSHTEGNKAGMILQACEGWEEDELEVIED